MKTYRVEFLKTEKKYLSANIEADSKKEAIDLAKSLPESDFEEKESVSSHDWKASKDWSFISALKSLFS